MKIIGFALLILVGMLLVIPDTSSAIPAFARKYGFNCNMCHVGFTKLNDFGQRFRDNGYQIPGQQGREQTVFQVAPPLSLRTAAGLMVSHEEDNTTSSFTINGLDLLAAGVMHKNISLLIIYTPRIDEPAADYTGAQDGTNPSQLGGLESANIVFSNLVQDALNVRVGRFEPAYHPFSSKRSYYRYTPLRRRTMNSFSTTISSASRRPATFGRDSNTVQVSSTAAAAIPISTTPRMSMPTCSRHSAAATARPPDSG